MTLKHVIRLGLFSAFFFSIPAIAVGDPFSNKTYQDGFNDGIAYAVAALAYKTYGMADTPYPVEIPGYDGWDKTQQTKITIHACVREHVARDLINAGGATNMLYQNITDIAKRVLAYCGAERTQAL